MMWGCIKRNGRTKLIKDFGNLNRKKLWFNILPNCKNGDFFQHDDDPCHISCIKKKVSCGWRWSIIRRLISRKSWSQYNWNILVGTEETYASWKKTNTISKSFGITGKKNAKKKTPNEKFWTLFHVMPHQIQSIFPARSSNCNY